MNVFHPIHPSPCEQVVHRNHRNSPLRFQRTTDWSGNSGVLRGFQFSQFTPSNISSTNIMTFNQNLLNSGGTNWWRVRVVFLQEYRLGSLLGLYQQFQPSNGVGQVRIQAQVCLRGFPQSQTDHSFGQTQLFWFDGETNSTISSVHSSASRPSQGNTSGT